MPFIKLRKPLFLKDGPKLCVRTMNSGDEWSTKYIRRIGRIFPEARTSTQAGLDDGWPVISEYFGVGFAEFSIRCIAEAFGEKIGKGFVVYRSGDILADRRYVLERHPHPSMHIAGDMMDRIPAGNREDLQAMLTSAKALVSGSEDKERTLSVGRSFILEAWRYMLNVTLDVAGQCFKCGGTCRRWPTSVDKGTRRVLFIMGNACTPWSGMGDREGWLHDASLQWLIALKDIHTYLPNRIVQECTVGFDTDTFIAMLSPLYQCSVVRTNPKMQGYPCARSRSYMIGRLNDGDADGAQWSHLNYLRVVRAKVCADASMYFCASPEYLERSKKELAKKMQIPVDIDGVDLPWVNFIGRAKIRRREDHLAAFTEAGKTRQQRISFAVVNLRQTPRFSRASSGIPALLQESQFYGFPVPIDLTQPCARELLPLGHIAVMGMPLFDPTSFSFKHVPLCFRPDDWLHNKDKGRPSPAKLRNMAGNGMHVSQIGIAILFAIS